MPMANTSTQPGSQIGDALVLESVQMPGQTNLHPTDDQDKWSVTPSEDWDVLGPFPIHAREQQFLSPSYPITNLSQPINFEKAWPSSYADNAFVRWSKTQLSCDGIITVAFPEIRWRNLRATEGWTTLQHHALLRGTLTVIPPRTMSSPAKTPRILAQLTQGSYFTILPADIEKRKSLTPQWYAGDIYNLERPLPRVINLPIPPDPANVTQYDIFISGDYEIRLFGDPHTHDTEIPTQVIRLSVQMESSQQMSVWHEPSQDVLCDFIDGFAFGDTIGIGFRSAIWTTIASVTSEHPEVELRLKKFTRVAPSQLRIVPLIISQRRAFRGKSLNILVTIVNGSGQEVQVPVSLPITQRNGVESQNHVAFKATYLFGKSMPTSFLAIPPTTQTQNSSPPILALHGAGVDIIEQTFWADALPPSILSWTIIPSGRTSWGLDWHGPSALDAWNSVDALSSILARFPNWKATAFEPGAAVIIIGHSNGGQGTWHISTRHPDRVLGIVPASGYIKSQAYVPLTMSRSAHYIDPALRAILETSLTPDDEDLFATNVMNKPILVVHGGADDNVPVWHGRELFSVVKTWIEIHGITSKISMKEDRGESHFYPTVLNNSRVQEFIFGLLDSQHDELKTFEPFTLTVFRPEESGSLNGWKIEQVKVLGRLTAVSSGVPGIIKVNTNNVEAFSISRLPVSYSTLLIDRNEISINPAAQEPLRFERKSSLEWKLSVMSLRNPNPSPPTRIQSFLSVDGPITFVLPTPDKNQPENFISLGFRLAHDLHVYHRIDSEIVQQHEVTSEVGVKWPENSLVVVGKLHDSLIRDILAQARTPIGVEGNNLTLNGHAIRTDSETGAIFLHPHPICPKAIMIVMIGESAAALERTARLFPIRTGITVPSWTILGSEMDQLGAAGISGAGIWGPAWTWNDAFSWTGFL